MNTAILDTSSLFLHAAASYWGIPPDQLILGKQSGAIDGVFSVQLTIALTPDDLVGITHRMGQMAQPEGQEERAMPPFIADGVLQHSQLRDDYAALSPKEQGQFKSFARYKAHRQAEQFDAEPTGFVVANTGWSPSEGVSGRKVQHVDVAEEQEAVSELPAAVWVTVADASMEQMRMASDVDLKRSQVLLQVALLTPEQKAKYCGEQKA